MFAINATIPVFLVMVLGWHLMHIGMLNENFCSTGNKYVFKCALPASLFSSISAMDLYTDFNWQFCLFCALGTVVMFAGVWALSALFLPDKGMIGAFSQGCTRSSAAILGVAFAMNIYGDTGMVPMMIAAAVPLFNVFAVLMLSFSPQLDDRGTLLPPPENGGKMVRTAAFNVLTNPIILGILAGMPFALLRITLPTLVTKTVSMVGGTASPVALLVVGAGFSSGEALKKWKGAAVASFIKLFLLPALYLPAAALLGFRDSEMVAILIMVGSPTTVASYIMAKSMHADSVLSSNIVVLTTLLSSISLTMWLFLLRSFALI